MTVTAKDGKQYHARKVVVTLPHGVLKSNDVRFTPPLPARHVQALNHLEMGVLNRIILKYDRPLWPADKYTFGWLPMVEDAPYFFSMAVNPKMEGRDVDGAILQFMVGGDSYAAMERYVVGIGCFPCMFYSAHVLHSLRNVSQCAGDARLPRSTIISELDQLLRRSFVTAPGARLIDATFSDWKHDPFAQGSYAYEIVGATHADRQQLSEPLLAHAFHADRDGGTAVVYFAGEHTDMDGEDGTTHAAYLSGIRAARRIFMPTDGDAGHPYFRMPVKKDAVAAGPPVA